MMRHKAEVKAKNYYMACMDVNQTIQTLGAQPLLDLIHRQFTGWTVNWEAGVWDFQHTLEKLHALGISSFFSFAVGADMKHPSSYILQVNWINLFFCVYKPRID